MKIFSQQLEDFKSYLNTAKSTFKQIKTNKKITYYNIACGFDIETSSFYDNLIVKPENKRAIMYAWKFGIEDASVIGRTCAVAGLLDQIGVQQALKDGRMRTLGVVILKGNHITH